MALNENYIRKVEYLIDNLSKRIYQPVSEISFDAFFTFDRLTFTEASLCERKKIASGTAWGKKWEYGWFFTTIELPEKCTGKRVCFRSDLGECLVYINGKIYGAFDKQHKEITLTGSAKGGEKYEVVMEVYAGHDGLEDCLDQIHRKIMIPGEEITEFPDNITQKTVKNGSFGIYNEEVFQCLMDIKVLYDLRNNLDDNMLRKALIDKTIKKVCDTLDIESDYDEFIEMVINSREMMKDMLNCKNGSTSPVIYAIGHSHLDLEWLWTRNETKRKIARTLGNQLKLLEEYDEYKYIQSQPWLLEVVKNDYPDLYSDVKRAVNEGKIIVEGGMWVEADTNIPSGESLVRQFLFGKKFIKEEFDTDSVILWLPDIFGCSASIPQIMEKCGIKYFMNAKITWQYDGGESFPHSSFMWQGIDGTRVQSFITQEYTTEMTPSKIFEKWNLNNEKEDVPAIICPFGHGDGGGGASRIHTEYLKREKDLEGLPKVVCKSPLDFYEYVNDKCEINKVYVGELYYPAHRGSYTTQALTKKMNRRCEFALRESELWSALIGNDKKENKAQLDEVWKKLLFNQFHDIIPGTSITSVYENTAKEYSDMLEMTDNITSRVIKAAINRSDEYITVFNSLSWDRAAFIELPDGYDAVSDMENNEIKTQQADGKIIAQITVPSLGMKSFKLYKKRRKHEAYKKDEFALENNLIIAKFNGNGELISLVSKKTNKEFLSGASNKFRLYKDMPLFFDAWDIDDFYEKQEVELSGETEVKVDVVGELMSALTIKKKINKSYIVQKAVLRNNECKIDFETEIKWNETHKLLKVDFDTNIKTDELISEIQFGHIKRPNHKSRRYDADRFEVCQHKWSALAESGRGVAVLNDCKYGISSDGGRISLTLLKASTAPALTADKGVHNLVYSIMPFSESILESDIVRAAYELNCPVCVEKGYVDEKSLIRLSDNNVILDTVKLSEDGEGIVLRLYESKDTSCDVTVSFGLDVSNAYITDMLENIISDADIVNNAVQLSFKPFEVKTIKLIRS